MCNHYNNTIWQETILNKTIGVQLVEVHPLQNFLFRQPQEKYGNSTWLNQGVKEFYEQLSHPTDETLEFALCTIDQGFFEEIKWSFVRISHKFDDTKAQDWNDGNNSGAFERL